MRDPEILRLCQPDGDALRDRSSTWKHSQQAAEGGGFPHDRTIFFPSEYPTLTASDWLPALWRSAPSSNSD